MSTDRAGDGVRRTLNMADSECVGRRGLGGCLACSNGVESFSPDVTGNLLDGR